MSMTGVDCLVAGLSNDPPETEGHGACATILAGKSRGAFGYSRELRRKVFLNTRKDSVVHNHGLWMYPGVVARKAAVVAGAPLVISAHGMLDAWALRNSALKKRVAGWLFENRNLRQAACLHALCEAEAKSYRDYGLRNPICNIPNGIDVPEIGNQKTESRNLPWAGCVEPGRKVLLYLGRIHPKKGLANLIRAWSEIQKAESRKQKAEEWVLAIAGWDQGGHELELKRLATELGIQWADVRTGGTTGQQDNGLRDYRTTRQRDHKTGGQQSVVSGPWSVVSGPWSVVFLGPQFNEAKTACYRNCDAFILPSFSEGLPMVILEAWAYGKPVLMTPQCNLPEGFAADAAIRIEPNAESLAQGLHTLFQSSISDLQSTGARGRALVAGRFAWPKIATEMKSVYEWLLGGGAKPECVV
jgi:poly(glycerol-phosphate) alpha-glucosyltransferase